MSPTTVAKRWNGWGDPAITADVTAHAHGLLATLVGPGTRPDDAHLDAVVGSIPDSRLAAERGLSVDGEDRVRHARGQSLPDWVALRSGRLGPVPDAVARPIDTADVRVLLERARREGWELVPYGGGTSVVGGVTVLTTDRPVVSVDLAALSGLREIDAASGLATFGAGTTGPAIEASLAGSGMTLGHYPQSFEYSTLGGWVATRSAGQESLGYGRIERLFAGGHVETPAGPMDLPPFPASAAGPDLRELILGSEGRIGIITDAIVRAVRRPQRDQVRAYSVPDWPRAVELARSLAQAGLGLSMVRVATPLETATTLALAVGDRNRRWLRRYLRWRGQSPEPCLVLIGMNGPDRVVTAAEGEVVRLVRAARGVSVPGVAKAWRRERFSAPYLRNALWAAGYAVDTLETALDWSAVAALAGALGPTLRHGLEADGERVHAFSHLSHVYPSGSSLYTTYVFRLAADPDETLARWHRLKRAASDVIAAHGGTVSHQHGVGHDHAPLLAHEKGALGLETIRVAVEHLDPDRTMHRGVLLDDAEA
ncbi:MAG: FAD-binding oxidoreductase [Chloroflexota bacterium]|nr:FAD-binding oxidoreductase [Chloroflexota bacterium]